MATYQAIGTGPVSFVNANQSQQEIPLSAISFGPGGATASAWAGWSKISAGDQAVVTALLNQMVAQGLLVQGTMAAATQSMTITAAATGSAGNMITVTFSNPSASAGTVTVAVNATEVYAGLTATTLGTVLASSSATSNALIFLESQAAGDPMPIAFTGSIVGPGFTLVVPKDASNDPAFTLGATDQTFAVNIAVVIDPPNPPNPQTFTLTATGSKTATNVSLATLEGASNPFALLVKFAGAAGGPLPSAGSVTLHGGAAASSTPATPAVATVYSS
jgi:hypothetical protein